MLVKLLLAIIGLALSVVSAYSAELPVTIAVTPQNLNLCTNSAEKALIVVQNNTQAPIQNVCLTFFSNGPIEAIFLTSNPILGRIPAQNQESCEGVAVPLLPKGGAFSALADIKLTGFPITETAIYFLANYQFGKHPDVAQATAIGNLNVHDLVIQNAEALKAETKVDFDSLHEKQKGRVLLTITNGTNENITLNKLTASSLAYASVFQVDGKIGLPLAISPHSIVAFEYVIEAKEKILPGRYVGFFDVEARTICGVSIHRVADYIATLGVFGQSELLTTIGVPSLLLLPGFLMLTLWMLLWRFEGIRTSFLAKEKGANEFFVGAKDPEFWLLGITFSLVIFAFSQYLPGLGYQQPYQLTDIAFLWGISLMAGIVLYVVMFRFDRYLESRRQKRITEINKLEADRIAAQNKAMTDITITTDDDVLTTLRRMKLKKCDFHNLPNVESIDPAKSFRGFRLWSDNNGQTYWVIPPIKCQKLNDQYYDLDPAGKQENTEALEKALREAQKMGAAKIDWLKNGILMGPKEMSSSEFTKAIKPFNFVIEE